MKRAWISTIGLTLFLFGCPGGPLEPLPSGDLGPDLANYGPPRGSVPCGDLTCVSGEACVESTPGFPPAPDLGPAAYLYHSCVPVPAACANNPDCACLEKNFTGGARAFCSMATGGYDICGYGKGPDKMADVFCPGY